MASEKMWVLSLNDCPDSVYRTSEEAYAQAKRLNRPDAGLYWHVNEVTVGVPGNAVDIARNHMISGRVGVKYDARNARYPDENES